MKKKKEFTPEDILEVLLGRKPTKQEILEVWECIIETKELLKKEGKIK